MYWSRVDVTTCNALTCSVPFSIKHEPQHTTYLPDMLPPPEEGPPPATTSMANNAVSALLNQPAPPRLLPTVLDAAKFLSSFFPVRARDVPWIYHEARGARYAPDLTPVARIVLAVAHHHHST